MTVDDHARRKRPLNVIQSAVEIAGKSKSVGARLLLNADDDCGRALVRAAASFQRLSDLNVSDIPHQNWVSIAGLYDNVADIVFIRSAPEALNDVLLPACNTKPGGGVVVGTAKRILNLAERDILFSQFDRIDEHLVLLLAPAGGYDLGDARNCKQAPAHNTV